MWHRLVFSLPDGALPLGGSAASPLQGFSWDAGRVAGLLCHFETTQASVAPLLNANERPTAKSPSSGHFVQTDEQILEDPTRFQRLAPLLDRVMPQWLKRA